MDYKENLNYYPKHPKEELAHLFKRKADLKHGMSATKFLRFILTLVLGGIAALSIMATGFIGTVLPMIVGPFFLFSAAMVVAFVFMQKFFAKKINSFKDSLNELNEEYKQEYDRIYKKNRTKTSEWGYYNAEGGPVPDYGRNRSGTAEGGMPYEPNWSDDGDGDGDGGWGDCDGGWGDGGWSDGDGGWGGGDGGWSDGDGGWGGDGGGWGGGDCDGGDGD